MLCATAGGSVRADALRRLQLHQDRAEALRQRVVDVAGHPVALFEHGLAPLFDAALFGEPALMQRQRRLPRHRFEQRAPPRRLAVAVARPVDSATQPRLRVGSTQRRDERRESMPSSRVELRCTGLRQPRIVSVVLDRLGPARLVGEEMRGDMLSRGSASVSQPALPFV